MRFLETRAVAVIVGTIALVLIAVFIEAAGSHRLSPSGPIASTTLEDEYSWVSAEPSVDFPYVRPAVDSYLAGIPRGARVLDLGCGNGAMLGSFLDRGWDLVGVDLSRSGLDLARRRWPQIRFELGDATGDLSHLGTFDAIFSTEVVEHLFLPDRFAANAHRLLKPGGTFVLTTPYHGWLKNVVIAVAGRTDSHYQPLEEFGHIKFWSVPTLSALLWSAGFTDLEYTGVGRIPYLWKGIVMRARKPVEAPR